MRIELTPAEILQGALAGAMRQAQNLRDNRRDGNGAPFDQGWQFHIEGALGEMAVAKALGLFWGGKGELRYADIGRLEVRTTPRADGRLILHKDDPDEAVFLLVTGCNGCYLIRGWLRAAEGKRENYWTDPAGGRPAYFVPAVDLHPLDELIVPF